MFNRLFVVAAVAVSCVLSVRAEPKDDISAAAKKLADAPNYAWKTTTEGGGNRGGGSTEGKTEKDGYTYLTIAGRNNNTTELLFRGDKGAVKGQDGWKSLEEAASGDAGQPNPGRAAARMAKNFKSPAVQAEELAGKAKDLAKADDAVAGTLSEDAAKELMTFGGRGRGGNANANAPTISNAKGTVKFWTKDGVLSKFQYTVQGTMNRNGNDTEVNRTTTVEITGVGSTKIDAPAEAKSKAGA